MSQPMDDEYVPVVPVMNQKFCYSHDENLFVKPENGLFKNSSLNVYNASGKLIFKVVKGDSHLLSTDRLILDASDSPVALLHHKRFSWNNRWRVYRGDQATEEACLFKVIRNRRNDAVFNVYAPSNDTVYTEKKGDVQVIGRFLPYTVYTRYRPIAIESEKNEKAGAGLAVQVYREIDCSFMVALMVIHGEIGKWKTKKRELAPQRGDRTDN